jgi:hypothetical protein
LGCKSFVKCNKNGKKSGTQKVTFLSLTDSKKTEPKEPIDISEWKRKCENSKAVIDKSSALFFVGIGALPSIEDRANGPGSLNGSNLEIPIMRKRK